MKKFLFPLFPCLFLLLLFPVAGLAEWQNIDSVTASLPEGNRVTFSSRQAAGILNVALSNPYPAAKTRSVADLSELWFADCWLGACRTCNGGQYRASHRGQEKSCAPG